MIERSFRTGIDAVTSHRVRRLLVRVSVALCVALPAKAQQDTTVTLHYHVRPPFTVPQGDGVGGLTGGVATAAFRSAGVPFRTAQTPAARFLEIIRANQGQDCGIGWFRNAERELVGKFTRPLYRDEPMVVLAAADSTRVKGSETLVDLLRNPELTLLVKQSYSYGRELGPLLAQYHVRREVVSVENTQMQRMVAAKRADYMFATPEETALTVAQGGLKPEQFHIWRPAGMPRGEYRYLYCSKAVPDATIERLNDALARAKVL